MSLRWTAAYYWILLPGCKTVFCFFFLLIIKLWVMCNWIQTNMHILTNSCIEDFLFQESWFCVHYLLRLHNATRFFFYFDFFLFSSIPCQERTYDSPQNNKKILPVAKRFNFSTIAQLQCGNQKGFFVVGFKSGNVDNNKCRILPKTFACYLGVK